MQPGNLSWSEKMLMKLLIHLIIVNELRENSLKIIKFNKNEPRNVWMISSFLKSCKQTRAI